MSFYKLKAHKALMGSLEFSLWIEVELLCYFLCLVDAIGELHAMDEKMFDDFLIGR